MRQKDHYFARKIKLIVYFPSSLLTWVSVDYSKIKKNGKRCRQSTFNFLEFLSRYAVRLRYLITCKIFSNHERNILRSIYIYWIRIFWIRRVFGVGFYLIMHYQVVRTTIVFAFSYHILPVHQYWVFYHSYTPEEAA